MKIGKKIAQTATEYLIILAVVIIIALIVVGVLGGIPGIGGSSSSNVADLYFESATIGVSGFAMSAAGADSIILKNNNAVDIEVRNISIGDTNILATAGDNVTIPKGTTKTISTAAGITMATDTYVDCSAGAGTAFSEGLTVVYQDKKTDAVYTFTSDQNLEGECAA